MWGSTVSFWNAVADWTLFAALVFGVIAVLCSFASSLIAGRVTTRVQDAAKHESDALKVELARANEGVATANETAAKAQANAANANVRAEALHKANLETQTRLVTAERELEAERTERLTLAASVAPRTLSQQQSEKLTAALKAAPQPLNIHLNLIGDEEANKYGQAIGKVFESARVQGKADGIGLMVPPPYGVGITLKAGDPKAAAIRAAFEHAGIPAIFSTGETGSYDALILVGLRPLGPNH